MQIRHSFVRAALAALLITGVSVLAAPAHAQLVSNGDFETADFTGWTLSGNANQGASPDTFVFGNPHSGDYAAWLGAPSSDGFLSQTVATTGGSAYTVSCWLAVDSADGAPTPNDFSASFGGKTLTSLTNLAATDSNADPAADYTEYTFSTVAAGPSSVLQFGFRDDTSEFRLDDVSVTLTPVPEASTTVSLGLLLALGLGAGTLHMRRRRSAG